MEKDWRKGQQGHVRCGCGEEARCEEVVEKVWVAGAEDCFDLGVGAAGIWFVGGGGSGSEEGNRHRKNSVEVAISCDFDDDVCCNEVWMSAVISSLQYLYSLDNFLSMPKVPQPRFFIFLGSRERETRQTTKQTKGKDGYIRNTTGLPFSSFPTNIA